MGRAQDRSRGSSIVHLTSRSIYYVVHKVKSSPCVTPVHLLYCLPSRSFCLLSEYLLIKYFHNSGGFCAYQF